MSKAPKHTRSGSSRLLPLLLGAVVLAGGGALAFRAMGSEEEPEKRDQVALPVVTPTASEAEVEPTTLAEPEVPVDDRPRGHLYGTIIDDKTEAPIEAFILRAIPSPIPTDPTAWHDCWTQRISGPAGEWGVPFLKPGSYTLRFEARGYAHAYFENIEIPSPLETLTVRMNHGRWFHGRIVTVRGEPVPDFPIRLAPQHSFGGSNEGQVLETETDADGMYDFSGVPEGRWKVEIAGLDGALREVPASEEYAPSKGEEIVWDLTLPKLTRIQLKVKFKSKRWIFVRTEARLTNSWGANILTPLNNGQGEFAFVEPGVYTLSIGKKDEDPWYTEIVEVEESDHPVTWNKEVTPPQRERPNFNIPRRGKKGKRGGQGNR